MNGVLGLCADCAVGWNAQTKDRWPGGAEPSDGVCAAGTRKTDAFPRRALLLIEEARPGAEPASATLIGRRPLFPLPSR